MTCPRRKPHLQKQLLSAFALFAAAGCADQLSTQPEPRIPLEIARSQTSSGQQVLAEATLKTFHASGNGRTREILNDGNGIAKVDVKPTNGTVDIIAPTVTVTAMAGTHYTSGGEGFGIRNPDDNSAERKSLEGEEAIAFSLTDSTGTRIGEFHARVRHYGGDADVLVETWLHGGLVTADTVPFFAGTSSTLWGTSFSTPITSIRFQALSGRVSIANPKLSVVEPDDPAPSAGLLAHYPFDGDFADATGSFGNGTPVAGAAFGADRLGAVGLGLTLDGLDSEVQLPAEITNSRAAGTINLWVQVVNPTTRQRCGRTDHPSVAPYHCQYNVFSKEGSTLRAQFGGAGVGAPLDRIYFRVANDSFMYTSPGAVSPTGWTMYTFVWDPSGKRTYINGQLAVSEPGSFTTASSGTLNLGSNGAATLRFRERLYGSMDEVRIYDRALDVGEISLLCDVQAVCGS